MKEQRGGGLSTFQNVEAIKAEAREKSLKESEGKLDDLLVYPRHERSKVDKLNARLLVLIKGVDKLL